LQVHEEIERVRLLEGGKKLLAQLQWRIRALCQVLGDPVDLTERQNSAAFEEVIAAYAPNNRYTVALHRYEPCHATASDGGEILFSGWIVTDNTPVAEIKRTLRLGRGVAEHRHLRVHPAFRGNLIAPKCLANSVALYDELGIACIRLRACYSGTWYWARCGFDFGDKAELDRVRNHAQQIVDAFGGGLDVSPFTRAQQFLRLGEPTEITFHQLVDAMPQRGDAYREIAADNGISMHDAIPFGRVVLLTGPSWDGELDLKGPGRLIFDDLVRRKLAE
jgi:GNAT superfamily N-acetyltransferase